MFRLFNENDLVRCILQHITPIDLTKQCGKKIVQDAEHKQIKKERK